MKSTFRRKLQGKKPLIGTFVQIDSPVVTEYLSMLPYDFILIEAEHSVISEHSIQGMAQSVKGSDTDFIVRIPAIDKRIISKYLDIGVDGMVIPQLRNKEEMEEIRKAIYYPPHGERGIGPGRVHGYGYTLSNDSVDNNHIPPIIVQIETKEALDNIEELVQYDFVDMLFIGPADLSLSLGVFGEYNNPLLINAIEKVIHEAKKYNKQVGMFAATPEMSKFWMEKGVHLIVLGSDIGMIGTVAKQYLQELKQ